MDLLEAAFRADEGAVRASRARRSLRSRQGDSIGDDALFKLVEHREPEVVARLTENGFAGI